jgi:quercetin dioxygenase-like cupin family protein
LPESGTGRGERATVAPRASRGDDELAVQRSSTAEDTERTLRRVGSQIRRLRGSRGLTLQDVAVRTGLSVSMLSMVERGLAGASIGTLVAVASALGVHMSDLFEPQGGTASPVVPLDGQMVVKTVSGVLRRVAHHDRAHGLEMVVNEFPPGTSSGADPVRHVGVEYGLVLEGRLVVEVDQERYELHTGDAITYDSQRPHVIINEGPDVARAVWVNLGD